MPIIAQLARPSPVAQHKTQRNITTIAVAVRMFRAIFLPQQNQRHAAPLELLMQLGPIGSRTLRLRLASGGVRCLTTWLRPTKADFKVTGDRFAAGFPPEVFKKTGLTYEPAQLPKSDLFNVMLPLLNSGKIVLPKNTRLINQIVSLERQVGRSGKDSISHPPNGHDDVANAVAGAAELAFHRGFDLAQWEACRFAELVGEGAISRDGAAELLRAAATLNGYLAKDGDH